MREYDYRYDYRDDRHDDEDYRDMIRMPRGRRGMRSYREESDYMEELSEVIKDGLHNYKKFEMLSEMTEDRNEKSKLMKMAEREKEHYKTLKEMLENHV